MRALVLGATGHIGQAVVRALIGRGYAVSAASRRAGGLGSTDLDVDLLTGDQSRPGQLRDWMQGHDIVVDASAPKPLGYFSPARGARDPLATARAHGARLVEGVERTGARLAFVSSFSTLRSSPSVGYDRGARWRHARNVYFRAKSEMERVLLEAGRRGLPITVVNPSAVFGPWEACPPEESVVARVLAGRLPFVMRHPVNVIDVRDLAAGIVAVLDRERFGDRTQMSGHDILLDDLARLIARFAGAPLPMSVDARLAEGLGLWFEGLWALVGHPAPVAFCAVPVVADAWPMGPSDQLRSLGLEPRPLERTIADAVHWHRSLGR
jgi:nucleoside-diphosphate-sugar epimerase